MRITESIGSLSLAPKLTPASTSLRHCRQPPRLPPRTLSKHRYPIRYQQSTTPISMHFSNLLAAILPVLAAATPIIKPRAGGPSYKLIPANCTITNPLPHASAHCGNGTTNGWMPSPAFTASNQIYSFYLEQPDFESTTSRAQGCLEQCHGLDGCVSALLAYNAPKPKGYYGTAGGQLDVGCMMFNVSLTPKDFVFAPKGQFVNETAGNIYC